jgi:ATP-binding cassette, subfamily A (ABC1), member 3
VWVCFLVLPWAIVPFTYVMSFMFSDDTNAQILTLLLHFLVCVILSTTVYFLQLVPETFLIGDKLRWWFCIIPTYCMMNAILWSSSGDKIIEARQTNIEEYPQLPTNLWAIENLGGDVLMMILHFFVDSGILALIEMNAFAPIKRWLTKTAPEPDQTIQYD